MDVEPVLLGNGQRQLRQEFALLHAQEPARPLDDELRLRVDADARIVHRRVVVAEHRDGALRDQLPHLVDGPNWIGAVADIIAEQHIPLGALRLRVSQARLERLPVRVNIRQQGNAHRFSPGVVLSHIT